MATFSNSVCVILNSLIVAHLGHSMEIQLSSLGITPSLCTAGSLYTHTCSFAHNVCVFYDHCHAIERVHICYENSSLPNTPYAVEQILRAAVK